VLVPAEEGSALLDAITDAMEERCREIAESHPPGPKFLESDAADGATAKNAYLKARGYEPIRWFITMVRPNLDDLPDSPLPDGLEIRPVKPDQLRTVLKAEAEALRDHWGFTEPTETDYEHAIADPVQGDYTLWRVAWDGDEIAGMVRGYINEAENERYDRKRGWVENISTRRPWRRRGLARALIAATIIAMRERGMTEGALGVDSENPSGALHLYESCGFVRKSGNATYRKPLVFEGLS
jgi:ribosomal protein S18 acetylase RimI-like enzyme